MSQTPQAHPPVTKTEIGGWASFDFANSSYVTVVITVIYAPFFTEYIVPAESGLRASYWSLAIAISTLIALTMAPLVGAICDLTGNKKKYLIATTLICSVATMLLSLVGPGDITFAIILVALSYATFMLSESFCGAFLTDIATPKNMGLISGIGWGVGYFGGIASLLMVKALVTSDPATDLPLYIEQNQTAMGATGLFFLVAALPTFLLVKNRTVPKAGFEEARLGQLFSEGFTQLKSTIANAKEHATFFKFLRAFLFYYAGMSACISFAGIFAKVELKLDTGELVMFFLVIQLCSAIGAMLFGLVDTRLGPRFTVLTTIYLWIFGSLLMAGLDPIAEFLETSPKTVFQFTGFILGLGVGSMQSSSRAVVGLLAPAEKSAEMFGFWGTFARLATLLGLAFGPLADFLGSLQLACLLLVVFFAIGAFLLSRLDLDGAIQR